MARRGTSRVERIGAVMAGENRDFSARSVEVLRLISEGRSYEQILSLHPELSYLDIFAAAREALDVVARASEDQSSRMSDIREAHPRAYEKWSTEEDMELTRLVAGGEGVEEISARLRRQPGAIRARMMRLNLVESGIEG